ncbi:hypothetical protein SUGI_0553000 [Cryptomeria japonica]|nr:hypothetical protein SUGI_0553000 [Cryptomeria japonica]
MRQGASSSTIVSEEENIDETINIDEGNTIEPFNLGASSNPLLDIGNCHVLKLLIPASLGTISEGSGMSRAVRQCFAGTDCLQSEDVANENQVAQDEENRTLLFAEFFSYLCVKG